MLRRTVSAVMLIFLSTVDAATFVCSSQNTSTRSGVYAMFQSQGLCSGTCAGYSFAILQGFDCYCSNFSPGVTVSSSQCNTGCPGFGSDNCGGTNNGAFAYYQLAQASGTMSLSSATAQSTMSTSVRSTGSAVNVGNVATASPSSSSTSTTTPARSVIPVTQTITQIASAVSTSTSASSTSIRSATPMAAATPVTTSIPMRTSSSSPTVASSPAATARAQSSDPAELQAAGTSNSFFNSAGKVAGTFAAVGLVLLALLGALLFFCCRRRRDNRSQSSLSAAALNRKPSPSSTLDGLTQGDAGRSRSGSTSRLMGYGLFAANVPSPGREKDEESAAAINWPRSQERTDILPIDQRLNPRPMLMRFDSNYSRSSLRDDQDYSRRVLTVANPDA